MSDRIRAALAAKPLVLWELFHSLKATPPPILSTWRPVHRAMTFSVGLHDINDQCVLHLFRDVPNTGPYKVEVTTSGKRIFDPGLIAILEASSSGINGKQVGFNHIREAIDDHLNSEGFYRLPFTYPDLKLAPWTTATDQINSHRPFFGSDLPHPHVYKNEDTIGIPNWWFAIPPPDGSTPITGTASTEASARKECDKKLIELGFDLAGPGCHDLTDMRRLYDKHRAARQTDYSAPRKSTI
jgi:hypothetical protein